MSADIYDRYQDVCHRLNELTAERDALRGEVAQLRAHVAHNDEEYRTMKDVLRDEHKACCEMRPVYEAAKAWRLTPGLDAPVNEGGSTVPWVRALRRLEAAIDAALGGRGSDSRE